MVSLIENRKCWIIHGKPGVKPTPVQELHPFLFPPVLNKIFGYLSVWNQKKCRGVCKSWDAEIRPFLRLNCKVNLTKLVTSFAREDEEKKDYQDLEGEHISLLKGLSQICNSFIIEEDPIIIHILLQQSKVQAETLLPLLSIKYLEIKNFKWDISQIIKLLRELPLLEELRLPILCSTSNTVSFKGKENLSPCLNSTYSRNNASSPRLSQNHTNKYISKSSSIMCNWKKSNGMDFLPTNGEKLFFPKLKRIIVTLTIRDLQFFEYKSAPITPILELIQLTPNLEEVFYPNIVQFTSPFDNPARVLLENIIHSHLLNRLAILKIDTYLNNADLKVLTARRLPFKSLQLTLTPAIQTKNLYEFLKASEPTLKSLTLTFRDGFKLTSAFPAFSPALETVAIILWNGHLDYLQEIEKLKILIIVLIEMEDEMLHKLRFHDFSHKSKLQELEIHGNRSSKLEMAQSILTLMPGPWLIKLTLDWVDDSLLQIIFATLPNLQEFGILYGGFTEAGITGIPPTFCREEYCDNGQEFYGLGLKRKFGVGDLKKLKSLLLTGDLTNVMLVLGVCQCQFLKHLELTARGSSKVGDVSIKKIANEMNSLEFLRLKNFNDLISPEGVTYLRSKFVGREIHLC